MLRGVGDDPPVAASRGGAPGGDVLLASRTAAGAASIPRGRDSDLDRQLGSDAGLARVARLADGWLASAYNTTPERFAAARESLARKLGERGRDPAGFPNALVTMWTWVSEDRAEADHMLDQVLAPLLGRGPDELRDHLCIGSAKHCAEVLSSYARAGCEWVQLWPLGDERGQIELVAERVRPAVESGSQAR